VQRRTFDPRTVRTLVLDEVDRMYDLGFREDVDRILAATSARTQTLLLSATLNADVERLIARHVRDETRIEVSSKTLTVDEVTQRFYVVDRERKTDLLVAVLRERDPRRTIVFVRTRASADRLARRLRDQGLEAQEIHSGLPQRRREQILDGFREGRFPLLVATDVAARGLDIRGVDHVLNYDIPENPEDYVHRVGRTARMGEQGWAVTFVTPDDGEYLTEIEKLINHEILQETFPGFERKPRHVPSAAAPKPAAEKPLGHPPWSRVVRRRR
jgi:ATP-dependent RNA helicase DeaD